ncbi:MAG: peptide deformylase [Candidatus Latescibacterota bacterium]|nr:MAG: peptide deformylase [Candidatus Latescibacterota bacterium]
MKELKLRYYGDPVLREVCDPIDTFDDELREFAESMIETMRREQGIGLAAPQVGVTSRIIVALQMKDTDDVDAPALALINPRVVSKSSETWVFEEGCLSIPGVSAPVVRSREVEIEYEDLDGETKRITDDFIFGRILLHEIDHLDGVLFVDYLSSAQRSLVKSRLKKISHAKHLF